MKQAKVFMYSNFAGILTEDENGYAFVYDSQYLTSKMAEPNRNIKVRMSR